MARMKKSGVPPEEWEQEQVIKWSQQPSVRKEYPKLAMLYHIPNERSDKVQAARLKCMGVKKGVPDLHLPCPNGKYHSLYIEMKAMDGRLEDEQLWWLECLKANGNAAMVCYGWQQAVEVLTWYLNLSKPA